MTKSNGAAESDYVFDLAAEDYWTPTACATWPHDKQPRIWFRIPDAPEAQAFSIAQAVLREEHGLASDDTPGFSALPEALDLYLDAALKYVTRIENICEQGKPLKWEVDVLAEHNLTKRGLLMRLGTSGQVRFWSIFGLVGTMMHGLRSGTRKNSASTSERDLGTTSTDAPAQSAPAATTETTSST